MEEEGRWRGRDGLVVNSPTQVISGPGTSSECIVSEVAFFVLLLVTFVTSAASLMLMSRESGAESSLARKSKVTFASA